MKYLNFFSKKAVNTNEKFRKAEVGFYSGYPVPRFSREAILEGYNGIFAAAIDYNVTAAAAVNIKLFARNSKNSRKCLFNTTKNYDKKYILGKYPDKPSKICSKIMGYGQDEDFEVVLDHPVISLIEKANPFQSYFQILYAIFQSIEVFGDAFIHVVEDNEGIPFELYVLNAKNIEIVGTKDDSLSLVEKYVYRNNGFVTEFSTDEIIHIKNPSPHNTFYGVGKIEKGWYAHLMAKYSRENLISLQANHGVPSHLIVNKGEPLGNGINRLLDKWRAAFSGRGAGGAGYIEGDVEISTVAVSPKDFSMADFSIQEIAAVTGCPLSKLVGNDNIKANSESQNLAWLRGTIIPLLQLVSSALTEQLLRRYGIEDGDAFLEFDNPISDDRAQKVEECRILVESGIISVNEARKILDMSQLDEDNFDIPREKMETGTKMINSDFSPEKKKTVPNININFTELDEDPFSTLGENENDT